MKSVHNEINEFNLNPGHTIARKYEVIEKLGSGYESEVYKISEVSTDIVRAAKLFFPQRNINNKTSSRYAKHLHKLRHCPIVIQYHTEEKIIFRKTPVTVLISEYIEGEPLSEFINRQRGKRLSEFQAAHFLYALIEGLEHIHHLGEYHGDLHDDNIIVNRFGLGFELKLLDSYRWPDSMRRNMHQDIIDAIRIFYDVLGGKKYYSKQSSVIKNICCGLKHNLILKKYKNASQLREHLELLSWD
jgi:serine/threonine protein kinase